jgi:hypothetical protein
MENFLTFRNSEADFMAKIILTILRRKFENQR